MVLHELQIQITIKKFNMNKNKIFLKKTKKQKIFFFFRFNLKKDLLNILFCANVTSAVNPNATPRAIATCYDFWSLLFRQFWKQNQNKKICQKFSRKKKSTWKSTRINQHFTIKLKQQIKHRFKGLNLISFIENKAIL